MQQNSLEGFELSPQQRRLWTQLEQEEALHGSYATRCVVSIDGPLERDRLVEAVHSASEKYEILRTDFHRVEQMSFPVQVVRDEPRLRMDFEEQRPEDSGDAVGLAQQILDDDDRATRSDDTLECRVLVVACAPDKHLMLVRVPALWSDGPGLVAFIRDVSRAYLGNDPARSDEPDSLQYADASTWLNDVLHSEETEPGRQFWRNSNRAPASRDRGPFEPAPGRRGPFSPRRIEIAVPPGLSQAASGVVATSGGTFESFALTCWQAVLQRMSHTSQMLVRYAHDGRGYEELQDAVGLFRRHLPLTAELPLDVSFESAISLVHEAVEAAKQWGDCFAPDSARPEGEPAAHSPAAASFLFEHREEIPPESVGETRWTLAALVERVDRFDLKLICEQRTSGVRMWIDFDASRYASADVQRVTEWLVTLIGDATAHPKKRIGQLALATQAEVADAVASYRANGVADPGQCFHEIFEAQARRTPDNVAVRCNERALTYERLDHHADVLAARLRGLGVGPDVPVGLFAERSVEMIVGILAVLKSGGAYMPLDPILPPARLAAMVARARAKVVVVQPGHSEPGFDDVAFVPLDLDAAVEPSPSAPPSGGAVEPSNLAYILFTSGSTGEPKGVAVEHRQLVNYVQALMEAVDWPAGASAATVSTFSADLGNTAIFPALASGGTVHVISEDVAAHPDAFGDMMQDHRVDILKIVPSHLEALLGGAKPERILPRMRLVLGGEACTWDLVDRVRTLSSECRVFNHYGPSETTVGVTVQSLGEDDPDPRPEAPPIGRAIKGSRVIVLDADGLPTPRGVPGELHIGGATLARGYINDPDATTSKFIPDPFCDGDGARMYKTGDLARTIGDGVVEFLGRTDAQVKIRGFRVELAEVEATLEKSDGVREAVVVSQADSRGDARLVGYVVAEDRKDLDASELRAVMKQWLPDYMVPSAIVIIDAIPLSPNGKVDRNALGGPTASTGDPHAQDGASTPASPWESTISEVWAELLDTDRVSAHDNFYDLGGHSLLAIQVVAAIDKRTGLAVSPRELVFHTLRGFAALCESKQSTPERAEAE